MEYNYSIHIELRNTPKDTEPWKSFKRNKCCCAESVESNLQTIQSKEKVGGAFMYMRYVNDSHFLLQAHVFSMSLETDQIILRNFFHRLCTYTCTNFRFCPTIAWTLS